MSDDDTGALLRDPAYNNPRRLRDTQIGSMPLAEADDATRELVTAMELLDETLVRRGWTHVLEESLPGVAVWDYQPSLPEDEDVTDTLMNENRAFITEMRLDAADAAEGTAVPLSVGLSLVGSPGIEGTIEPDFLDVEFDGLDAILGAIEAHRHDSGPPEFLVAAHAPQE